MTEEEKNLTDEIIEKSGPRVGMAKKDADPVKKARLRQLRQERQAEDAT